MKLEKTENGSLLGTRTEQDLKRTQGETIHSYLAQAVFQVLQIHAVHVVRGGMLSPLIEVDWNHFHAEAT